jgi:hypothetical protein
LLPSPRLEPPPGLSQAEREVFKATVNSVKPEHFAAEDAPLLSAYCAAVLEERTIASALTEASEDDVDHLRIARSRAAGDLIKLARALRLGPIARDATHRRRPGTVRSGGERPWDYRPRAAGERE